MPLLGIVSPLSAQTFQSPHSAKTSLDWSGTYLGTLPCADCPGIRTAVRLNADNTYTLKETYLEKNKKPLSETGSFKWQSDGSRIILKGKSKYQFLVAENRLIRLNSKGKAISGANAKAYILKKSAHEVTEKYWKLIELNGTPIDRTELKKEPHIIFSQDSARVHGFSGCNSFGGTFKLGDNNKITLSQLHATLMACPSLQLEGQFMKALESVRYYQIVKEDLILQDAEKRPLARLTPVYLK